MRKTVGAAMVAMATVAVSVAMGADPYPAGAKGFAGMIAGKVVGKGEDQIAVQVTKIDRVWKHSKAENPEALVGKDATLKLNPALYARKEGYLAKLRQFLGLLKVGDSDTFDVKHDGSDALIFLELTKAQAERVEQAAR